jgi:heat shock protein HslJ
MNSADQETIVLTTPASQYSIAPGEILEIPVTLINRGSTPDQLRIGIEGIPLVWVSTEQPVALLQPGEQRQILLTIRPPMPPNVQIGRYTLKLQATSTIAPSQTAQAQVALTVAGLEVKGRIGVLLNGVQYAVTAGEKLEIPVVLINQGFAADALRLTAEGAPSGWVSAPESMIRLQPGEIRDARLIVQPPRDPSARAGRYPFRILVASQEAPDQTITIDCTLTVAAFIAFESALEAAQPDQNLPAKVWIHNLSNIPTTFRVNWDSPQDSLRFEPNEPQQINAPSGEAVELEYRARPARRPLFGGEKGYPYTVNVQVAGQPPQTLDGTLIVRGLIPTWTLVSGIVVLALLCLYATWSLWLGDAVRGPSLTETPIASSTATVLAPTATQSQIDQRPLLIERNWYLVAYNDARSSAGVQEAHTLFNPNGTLVGYTGCKDLSANYQTNFNQISITNLNLGPGACPDPALQQQEAAMIAILRSARSYFVADTALQIAGDAGFLNYSLYPLDRSEAVTPPQAVIQMMPQAQVGQVVVFDGSASSGQAPLVSWSWDFGDGTTASGVVVQHTYRNPGAYNVRLAVTDQRGQTGSNAGQIHILPLPTPTAAPPTATPPPPYTPVPTPEQPTATPEPPPPSLPPQANIAGPGQGFIGEPVEFDASASQPGSSPIVSFSWSLGNGVNLPASPDSSISAIYDRAGDYEVAVFVTDADGLSSYATTRITIDARLETDVWTLSTINTQPLAPGTAITLQFKAGELAGFAGCNAYHGDYTATANEDGTYTIAIGRLRSGRLRCPQDIMEQEQEYLAALQQANVAMIRENTITLNSPSGSLVFYLIEAR